LEHQISDFKKVKEIIENSTYEKRKSKKKSKIRAKTLEINGKGTVTGRSYENTFGGKKEHLPSFRNKGGSPESRKSFGSQRSEEHQINPRRARYLSPYDHHSYSNPENESKGSLQLKELMHNINIMCMMENNYRKFFSTSQKKEIGNSMVSRCFEKNKIVLGKRGRPSKSSAPSPCIVSKKMVGSYLSSLQSKANSVDQFEVINDHISKANKQQKMFLLPPESLVSTSINSSSSQVKKKPTVSLPVQPKPVKPQPKPKEIRKKCPVYFDEMLMELLYISQKQTSQTRIFYVKREKEFKQIDGRLVCLGENQNFSENLNMNLTRQSFSPNKQEFEILKVEQKMTSQEKKPKLRQEMHYKYGSFLDELCRRNGQQEQKGEINEERESLRERESLFSEFGDQRPRQSSSFQGATSEKKEFQVSQRKRKGRAHRRSISQVSKMKGTNHSFCEYCSKSFTSFFEFLHHVQTIHQTNVEEVV
jgi:hypothetical protein